MDLAGSVAAITGGAGGLGAATARHLAEAGARVAILDLDEGGAALADDLGGSFHKLDVTDAAACAAVLGEVAGDGRLDLMVNCAGIAPAAKTVGKHGAHDPALFAKVISINLLGSFHCASAAAAIMAAQEGRGPDGERGVIVNTASIAAFEGQIGQAAYAASKGGVAGMTLPMARDLAPLGIRVVSIAPGLFLTPMLKGLPQEVQDSLGAQVPYPPRLGDPAEFASLVGHIATNPMLNGATLRLDGAIRLAPR
ncbi:SDR family NAD(P)-dependent oxidoreductase [Jannaschia seohaensis]|uniref:NAD(P)-dependent dehydrogenase (Short-subunit alcohol dehydrogenase family) n=1 Tax=Jannaschia seohaensis TaxID=475081 RepID=A0A2Y9B139_9RHOB|nr:SDR family NAD(P)-dependent oxidoreductase [Jannaschia seohaensis]PWJ14407.1 NAD(P)-dependent dehydrogenase (short-subunit alcohol dehydrogenase family) [Jannaschia seohaensis]SSA50126.1 NAD(P)-dependent dehydrogenase, short-chain alcohol dehydrogenase family [Jannaschia seohaensis]